MLIMRNYIFCAIILTVTLSTVLADEHWHYPTPGSNGVIDEAEHWGGKCDTGKRQSPVDLTYEASVKGAYAPFSFRNYVNPIRKAKITNTGHSIQINNNDNNVLIVGGGLPGTYVLDQLHFHWGSEHTIQAIRYGLELHIVHHDTRFANIQEASNIHNGIAVLGILFHVSAHPNPDLEIILNSAEPIKGNVSGQAPLVEKVSPYRLLPNDTTTYFRYDGSLTTPGCGEAVIWTVFTHSLPISLDQVERFKTIKTEDGHELLVNFRSLQPLNARALVYVTPGEDPVDNSAIKSSAISFTILMIVSAIFQHFLL
uniref:Carbonic anhydrase n=1 Tax=Corethrella appendiculata TaxID=1370023 RepID=U5EY71_9DIPT